MSLASMKLHKSLIAVLLLLTPFSALTAGPKEDFAKVEKDLISAQKAHGLASKAWFEYKKGKKFPKSSAEESKKVSEAHRKLLDALKTHPDLAALNKEVEAAKKQYADARKAQRDAKAKKAPEEKQDELKANVSKERKVMFTAKKKQSAKSKTIPAIQKLRTEETIAANKAEATRYASDPQAKSLFNQNIATAQKRDDLQLELNALKAKLK